VLLFHCETFNKSKSRFGQQLAGQPSKGRNRPPPLLLLLPKLLLAAAVAKVWML
jgi:hypothetical protein